METLLLLMILETGEVTTAVTYPSYEACTKRMHEVVAEVGTPMLYWTQYDAYTDEAQTYVLLCEEK